MKSSQIILGIPGGIDFNEYFVYAVRYQNNLKKYLLLTEQKV
jgi:hypothetical protein